VARILGDHRTAIGAYLYLIMSTRTEAETGKNTLRVLDYIPTEENLQTYEATWEKQQITKREGISCFDDFKARMRGGLKAQILA